jgi:hypothetical protein
MEELYTSSINFWSDMVEIAKVVDHSKPKPFKLKWIKERLDLMNKSLPSFVFIPSSSKFHPNSATEQHFNFFRAQCQMHDYHEN